MTAAFAITVSCTTEKYRPDLLMESIEEADTKIDGSIVRVLSDTVKIINWHFYPNQDTRCYPKTKINVLNSSDKDIEWVIRKTSRINSNFFDTSIKIDNKGNIRFNRDNSGKYIVWGIVNKGMPDEYKTKKIILEVYLAAKYDVRMSVSDAFLQKDGTVSAFIAQWTVLDDALPLKYHDFVYCRDGRRNIVQSTLNRKLYALGDCYLSRYYIEHVPFSGTPVESCFANIEPMYTLFDLVKNRKGPDLPIQFNQTREKYYFFFIKGKDYRTEFFKL